MALLVPTQASAGLVSSTLIMRQVLVDVVIIQAARAAAANREHQCDQHQAHQKVMKKAHYVLQGQEV